MYPASNPGLPSYAGHADWSGGYKYPHMDTMRWQRGYEPQRDLYGSVYGSEYHSGSNHRHVDFTTDSADPTSFHNFSQGQYTHSSLHLDSTQTHGARAPYYPPVTKDASPYEVIHHPSTHMTPPVPTNVDALQSGQSGTHWMHVETTTTFDSNPPSDYAGSFLAQVQKFVVRHSEAFDLLVEGHRGCEEEIHHNAHSGEMCEFKDMCYVLFATFSSQLNL